MKPAKPAISRTEWFVRFEISLLNIRPELAGHMHWGIPTHAFLSGKSPDEAAEQYCKVADLSKQLVESIARAAQATYDDYSGHCRHGTLFSAECQRCDEEYARRQ